MAHERQRNSISIHAKVIVQRTFGPKLEDGLDWIQDSLHDQDAVNQPYHRAGYAYWSFLRTASIQVMQLLQFNHLVLTNFPLQLIHLVFEYGAAKGFHVS